MPKWLSYFLLLLSLSGYVLLGYFTGRSQFPQVITIYSSLFIIYFLLLKYSEGSNYKLLTGAGILFRFMLLFSIPVLSDDFYRFMWDGRLLLQGISPFSYLPEEVLSKNLPGLRTPLFNQLNSPSYYSVYPTIYQAAFWLSALVSPNSTHGFIFFLKLIIFFFECATIYLLPKLLVSYKKSSSVNAGQQAKLVFLYSLNPLVILELTGNIHFEGIMIFFTLLSVWLLMKHKQLLSALAMALAICTKLLPLLFLPLLIKKMKFKQAVFYIGITAVFCLALILPVIYNLSLAGNYFNSLQLYYGKFEFNGSIYLVFRWVGMMLTGHNPIFWVSKLLLIVSLIFFVFTWMRSQRILSGIFWLLFIQLVFSAVVHPWYLTPLIALTPFVRYRFAIVWSALIPFTYIMYSTVPYLENYWFVGMEYMLVFGWLVYERQLRIKNYEL